MRKWIARLIVRAVEARMRDRLKQWIVNVTHGVNVAVLGAQILNALPPKPWVMVAQAVLGALLPSLGGVGHAVVFGGRQQSAPPSSRP